jgi:hypothetical protein
VPQSRTIRLTFGALLIAAAAAWVFTAGAAGRLPDFEVYWRAGSRAADAQPLYLTSDEAYQFKYFPAFAVAAIPLGLLPLPAAKAVWFAGSVVALLALLALSLRVPADLRKPAWWLVVVLLVALGKYYAEDLVLGQINILLTLIVTGALVLLRRGREAPAGALIALAVLVKPYALILLPWLVARRRVTALVAAGAGLMLVLLLPAVVYGPAGALELHEEWWRTVSDTTAGTLTHSDNVSIAGMFTKWLGAGTAASLLTGILNLALLGAAAFVIARRRHVAHPDPLEGSLLLMLTPLLSPQGWDYVVVVSTPAIALLATYHNRLSKTMRIASTVAVLAIGLTLYDLLGRRLLYALLDVSVITVAFGVVFAALCTLRTRRVA